jgi:ankyrin repeat protein
MIVQGMQEEKQEKLEENEDSYYNSICCICYDKFDVMEVKTKLNHKVCLYCVRKLYHDQLINGVNLRCPLCRRELTHNPLEYEFILYNNFAELSTETIKNVFPMLPFCSNVTIDDIAKWLQHEVDVNSVNLVTALTSAATKGNLNVLEFLITNGANVNLPTIHGETPLIKAAINGHIDIIKTLLKHKAEVNRQTNKGLSALHCASQFDYPEIIKLLIENEANIDIDKPTNLGFSALHLASIGGNLEIMKILIENGANVNRLNEKYGAPLHQAMASGNVNVIRYLISEAQADINLLTCDRTTPLMTATARGHFEIVKVLLEQKAEVNIQTIKGLSALHLANGCLKIAELLIQNGANVDID